jgi:hypothetical protein
MLSMSQPARQEFTSLEYVLLEEIAHVKHEFLDGEVWSMAGRSPDHAALRASTSAALTKRAARSPVPCLQLRSARAR